MWTARTYWRPNKKEKKSGSLLKYLQDAIIHFCNYFSFTNRLHTFYFIYLFKNPKYTSTVIIATVAPTGLAIYPRFLRWLLKHGLSLDWNDPLPCNLSYSLFQSRKTQHPSCQMHSTVNSITLSSVQQNSRTKGLPTCMGGGAQAPAHIRMQKHGPASRILQSCGFQVSTSPLIDFAWHYKFQLSSS